MAQHQQSDISNSGCSGTPGMSGSEIGRDGAASIDWPSSIHMQTQRHQYFLQAQQGRIHPDAVPVSAMESVLDVGCGNGEWIFDLVKRYPQLMHVVGVDSRKEAIVSATVRRNLASLKQVSLMQCTLSSGLPFDEGFFDFVHMRNRGYSIPAAQWSLLLSEFARVLKPGGWATLVDIEFGEISSPAMMCVVHLLAQIMQNTGLSLDTTGSMRSPAAYFYSMLLSAGFENVSYDLYLLDCSFQGGVMVDLLLSNMVKQMAALKEYAVQMGLITAGEFDEMISQAEQEIQEPHRCGWAMLVSAYGQRETLAGSKRGRRPE